MPYYDVKWEVVGHPEKHKTRVQIIPGYTTVNDIPRIIATSRTGRPSDSVFIRVTKIKHVRPE